MSTSDDDTLLGDGFQGNIGSSWFNSTKLMTRWTERAGSQVAKMSSGERYQNNSVYGPDGSDMLGNKGFVVDFQHVPSGKKIYFKAFLENYVETFSPEWNSETVYGRMDPIYLFKNTTRNISIALKIPAATESEAYENLAKVQALTQFLYPMYWAADEATTIAQSPLLRLGIMNMVRSREEGSSGENFSEPRSYHQDSNGLLGVLKSLTINHNLAGETGVIERGPTGGNVLPKLIEINFDFDVIHEHALGWDSTEQFSTPAFPYGTNYEFSQPQDRAAARARDASFAPVFAQDERSADENSPYYQTPDQLRANAEARYAALVPRPTITRIEGSNRDASGAPKLSEYQSDVGRAQTELALHTGEYDESGFDSSTFDTSWKPGE